MTYAPILLTCRFHTRDSSQLRIRTALPQTHCLFVYCLFVYLFTCLFVYLLTLRQPIPVQNGPKCEEKLKKLFTEVLGWAPVGDRSSSRASKTNSTLLKFSSLPSLWISALYLQNWLRYRRFLILPFFKVTDEQPNDTSSTCTSWHVAAILTIQSSF